MEALVKQRWTLAATTCVIAFLVIGLTPLVGVVEAHQDQPAQGKGQPAAKPADDGQGDIAAISKSVEEIKAALAKDQDPDFALVLGLGSLLVRHNVTDYLNQSNVLQSTSLGRATPQLLAGVSFRTRLPSPLARFRGADCGCELWEQRPWSAFVSVKFSPGSSQAVNGYVIGGSFALAHHVDVLVGYSLTPINEPSPGLRAIAYQYVVERQKKNALPNFDANALAANDSQAFDGFSLTDADGKLIYNGNPLTVHYRGSTLVGVSIPVYFKTAFGK